MMDRVRHWFNRETSSMTVAAMLLAAASFAADILGLLRDRLLAARFGAGEVLDIYYAGFRIPDLLLNLLVLGAVSSAFLPVFAERFQRDPDDARRFAANVCTIAALALTAVAAVLFLFIPEIMPLIAPGFGEAAMLRAVRVTRLLLLSPILFGISSLASAILHYFQRFVLYSLAPILYNLGIIIGTIFLAPRFNEVGIAAGVVLGAAMHLGIQLPGLRSVGFRPQLVLRPVHHALSDVVRLAVPRTVNLVVNQLQVTVLTAIASLYIAGSIAVFNFALNLESVPVGVIGISFATAAFPMLSRFAASASWDRFGRTLRETVAEVLFFTMPATVLFLVLRAHIVRVVLNFPTWEDTRFTAAAFGAFALAVVPQSLLPVLVRACFAKKDTRTPLRIATLSAVVTVGLTVLSGALLEHSPKFSAFFGQLFRVSDLPDIRVVAIPLAIAIGTALQVVALLVALRHHFTEGELRRLLGASARLLVASVFAGVVSWAALRPLAHGVVQETGIGILLQGAVAGIFGILAFLFIAILLAFPEARHLVRLLRASLPSLRPILPKWDGLDEEERRGLEQ